jgi:GTP-binding protein Era
MTQPKSYKSGYAAIIGKPNVGKSTLLNRLVSVKIAATSKSPQTTRNKITGVCHFDEGQVILLDTPGVHKATSKFNKIMVKASFKTYDDVDVIVFVLDAKQKFCEEDKYVLETLQKCKVEKILALNKIDLVPKAELLPLIEEMSGLGAFTDIVPISALKDDGMDVLVKSLLKRMPEGPQYFPEGSYTDCPESFLIGEIIREKAFRLTRFEVPYSLAVMVENLEERENGMTVIKATIIVEKDSQKKIVIGKSGGMLKEIGSSARRELERRFNCKVFLSLFVKVKANWRESDYCLKEFGYGNDSY